MLMLLIVLKASEAWARYEPGISLCWFFGNGAIKMSLSSQVPWFVLDLQIRTDWNHMMFASTFKSMINIIEYVQNINLKLKT